MITKSQGFLSRVGNIFKTEEQALEENRKEVLAKYLLKEDCRYDWSDSRTTVTKTIIPDNMAINNFLKYYDDVIRQLKEVDKNVN